MVGGGTPNTLLLAGINRKTGAIGSVIKVRGYQARSKRSKPACKANGRDIKLPDGGQCVYGIVGHGCT